MSEITEKFDPENTIVAASGSELIGNYSELREEYGIYPGEDGSQYHELKLLGMGGIGAVFSGEDPTLQRQVAVKILREPFRHDREQIAKFINEARITAKIDHPNIVAVHQLGVNEHHGVYFSMRRISGETLQTALRKLREGDADARRTYTRKRLVDIFIAGCNAVAAAHEKKILHCDLKPANIMIGAFGEVMLLDWGLAREEGSEPLVRQNKISGTPAYMAPELVTGAQSMPDVRSEIYALGTILFSILTWHPAPFDMELEKTLLLEKVALGKHLPLRAPQGGKLPRELAAICSKAMAQDPEQRYESVTDLLNDIYNFRDGRPVRAYSPNICYRFFKHCRRHPAIPVAFFVAVMTLFIHSLSGRVMEFAHNRSLLRSTGMNMQIADNHYRKCIFLQRKFHECSAADNPLKLVIEDRDIQLQVNMTLTEYFSILDSVSSLSPAGRAQFTAAYAPLIFRRVLELAMISGNSRKVDEVLERCRRSEVFEKACRRDSSLQELVRRINDGIGIVKLNNRAGTARHAKLISANGDSREIDIDDQKYLALADGEYSIVCDDGIILYLKVIPGSRSVVQIPAAAENGFRVIPQDNFELDVPGSGKVRCHLSGFVIREEVFPGEYSLADAHEKVKSSGADFRLPNFAELLKAWSQKSDGSSYYQLKPASGKVWLDNGMVFNPRTWNMEPPVSGAKYLVCPVKVIE